MVIVCSEGSRAGRGGRVDKRAHELLWPWPHYEWITPWPCSSREVIPFNNGLDFTFKAKRGGLYRRGFIDLSGEHFHQPFCIVFPLRSTMETAEG